MRWGLLGAARITDRALAPAVRTAGHHLAIIGARSPDRARTFAERHGVAAAGSYDDVLAADLDAVYIALPNDLHEPWTVAALRAGKHVLCEKPLALDAAAAGRVAAAASSASRLVMEALMTRFHPRTQALLDLVHGGGIGELRTIATGFSFPMDRPADYRGVRAQGGGALLDIGIYGVAVSRWLAAAEPGHVQALVRRWPSGVDASTSALLAFPSGAVAAVTASFEAARAQFLQIVGITGTLTVPEPFTAGGRQDTDAAILRDDEPIGSWRANPYVQMVRAFGTAIADGARSAPLPITDAVGSAAVLDAISASAVTVPTRSAAPRGGPSGRAP